MGDKKKGLAALIKGMKDKLKNGCNKEEVTELFQKELRKSALKLAERKGEFSENTPDGDEKSDIAKSAKGSAIRNILLKSAAGNQDLSEFQEWSDQVYLVNVLMTKAESQEGRQYDVRKSQIYKEGCIRFAPLKKAMDTAEVGVGAEWIPTLFSSKLIEVIRAGFEIAGLYNDIQMPSDPFTLPIAGADKKALLLGESTADDATKITTIDPGTRNVSLASKKLGARVLFSEELSEDSIIAITPYVREQLGIAISAAIEDAIVNGDTNGVLDSEAYAATSNRKAWDGLRQLTQAANKINASNTTLTAALFRSARAAMGKYGTRPTQIAVVAGNAAYIKMLDITEIKTMDVYGPQATILTGEVAKIDGMPVILSDYVREDLNASGIFDGTTTNRTQILLTNRRGYTMGSRRAVTVKAFEDVQTDQMILVATIRKIFKNYLSASTDKAVSFIYNVPTS